MVPGLDVDQDHSPLTRAGSAGSGAGPRFFSAEWAAWVGVVADAGPAREIRAGKQDTYWGWIDRVRAGYGGSWALSVRHLPPHGEPACLLLEWRDGRCVGARIADVRGASSAAFLLSADYADWQALLGGYDPGRAVIYRKLLLERGSVLEFFRVVYFFIEVLRCVVGVPTSFTA